MFTIFQQVRQLSQHSADEKCDGCGKQVACCQTENHPCKPCPLGCGRMVRPGNDELQHHSTVCLRALCDCSWQEMGCTMQVLPHIIPIYMTASMYIVYGLARNDWSFQTCKWYVDIHLMHMLPKWLGGARGFGKARNRCESACPSNSSTEIHLKSQYV